MIEGVEDTSTPRTAPLASSCSMRFSSTAILLSTSVFLWQMSLVSVSCLAELIVRNTLVSVCLRNATMVEQLVVFGLNASHIVHRESRSEKYTGQVYVLLLSFTNVQCSQTPSGSGSNCSRVIVVASLASRATRPP